MVVIANLDYWPNEVQSPPNQMRSLSKTEVDIVPIRVLQLSLYKFMDCRSR